MSLDLQPVLDELTERRRMRGDDMNVATMTIVVFFEDQAIGALARDRIHALAAKHPSRVIILDGMQQESLRQVEADDWIELGVKDSGPALLSSAVGALRLPDAPVVLLWIAAGISHDSRFGALSEQVRTVVYNSSLIDLADRALREFIGYVEAHPELAVSDIPYLRLEPWQESIATLFDSKEVVQELFDLRHVEIACGSDPEAFYLLGWLASRLEWTPCAPNVLRNRFGTQVDFTVLREGEPRRIRRVVLSSSRSTFTAEVDEGGDTICLHATGSARTTHRYHPINAPGIAALVERAILWGPSDAVFHDALVAAGEILAQRKE
jgi:glucose-6-phosphate dehydrogenase assembly protein OpcA